MKLKVWIATDKVGSKCERITEVPDEELEDLTPLQRERHFEEYARDEIWNMADWGYSEIE